MKAQSCITLRAAELASRVGADLAGEGNVAISGVAALESAGTGDIAFVSDVKHESKAASSQAAAFIVSQKIEGLSKPQLVVSNVEAALIAVLKLFAPRLKAAAPGIHATAAVDKTAVIADNASVGPFVCISSGVHIGENTVIGPHCSIGENSRIGNDCRVDAGVVIYHNCVIGNAVIIQANTAIGSTGFGYSYFDNRHNLIPHNGGVIIEDYVEIGANCCIDRAKFGNTIIGAGTKIDNLVQIAHNVVIGKCCLLVAQVGIAGSSTLGNGVVLGGQVGVADHASIGEGTMMAARSVAIGQVGAGLKLAGAPPVDIREAIRIAMATLRLPDTIKQVKELAGKVKQLEAANDNTK